jgi:hypothetical protein
MLLEPWVTMGVSEVSLVIICICLVSKDVEHV